MREPTPRPAPTARQATVLRFIRQFAARRGYPPTYAEIAEGLAFRSQNAAREHVRLLARKELLVVEPGRARGLRVVADDPAREGARAFDGGAPDDGLPVVGEVAAGQPILAQENVERTLAVDRAAFAPRADFLLRVRGDSMIEAGIEPDDLLAVHRTASVRDGAIAVVRLDDDVTVKRWRVRGRRGRREVVLEPANRALSPIVVDPTRVNVAVEGLVVGLIRSLGARRTS
jgi:repressor LexA